MFVKTLVKPGDRVRSEYDFQSRDKYGSVLGYIFFPDDRLLNEAIVKAGYANFFTISPNVKHEKKFRNAHREARDKRKGPRKCGGLWLSSCYPVF